MKGGGERKRRRIQSHRGGDMKSATGCQSNGGPRTANTHSTGTLAAQKREGRKLLWGMGVVISKSGTVADEFAVVTARPKGGGGVNVLGRTLFRNLAAPASPVFVLRQVKDGEFKTVAVPEIVVCAREEEAASAGSDGEEGRAAETTTVRTKSTASIDSDEQHWFSQTKRECFRTVSDPGSAKVASDHALPGVMSGEKHDAVPTEHQKVERRKSEKRGKYLDTAMPMFHPGLWPIAASSAANSRSTGCLATAGAAADPVNGGVVHPAISSANLASRLKPREVRGRDGGVFAHPAVVAPGAVGALEREEMGRIGFGALSPGDAGDGGVWSKRSKSVRHVRKKNVPKLERQMSLVDIEFDGDDVKSTAMPAGEETVEKTEKIDSENKVLKTNPSSSSLGSDSGNGKKKRHNSGLFKRHSFGTKEDRKSTSVDNFLAVIDSGGGLVRSSRRVGGSSDSITGGGGAFFSRNMRDAKGLVESATLTLKEPLMALRKFRPGVAAAATVDTGDEGEFCDLGKAGGSGGRRARSRSLAARWLGRKTAAATLPVSHKRYRVGVGITDDGGGGNGSGSNSTN